MLETEARAAVAAQRNGRSLEAASCAGIAEHDVLSRTPVIGGVLFDVRRPLGGDLVLGRDRVDRARLDTGVAVDAFLRIDVQLFGLVEAGLVGGGMDAVNGADLDTRDVLDSDA